MEGMRTEATTIPSAAVAEEAREALRALVRVVQGEGEARVSLHTAGEPNGVTVTLPREAIELFVEVLGQMANGNAVTVVPVYAELTTHQAAEILNVSRPYLIGLLDACKIPFRMVGTHRRVRFTDLMAYKQQDDARRDEALAELTRQAQDLGLGS
jgi:excisionase family DNA binding protein